MHTSIAYIQIISLVHGRLHEIWSLRVSVELYERVPYIMQMACLSVIPRTSIQRASTCRLIAGLENVCLQAYRVGGSLGRPGSKGGGDAKYALLNCDNHQCILAKTGYDIADAMRPGIMYQCLLTLLSMLHVGSMPHAGSILHVPPNLTPGVHVTCHTST